MQMVLGKFRERPVSVEKYDFDKKGTGGNSASILCLLAIKLCMKIALGKFPDILQNRSNQIHVNKKHPVSPAAGNIHPAPGRRAKHMRNIYTIITPCTSGDK